MTDQQWLEEQFEYEDCYDCGQGAEEHLVASDLLGNDHAWCRDQD